MYWASLTTCLRGISKNDLERGAFPWYCATLELFSRILQGYSKWYKCRIEITLEKTWNAVFLHQLIILVKPDFLLYSWDEVVNFSCSCIRHWFPIWFYEENNYHLNLNVILILARISPLLHCYFLLTWSTFFLTRQFLTEEEGRN